MKILCILPQSNEALPERLHERLADAFYRITPDLAVSTKGAVFLDLSRCRTLYRPDGVIARVRVILRKFKISANMAWGKNAGHALAFARARSPQNKPQSHDSSALDSLKLESLSLESLTDLGDPFSDFLGSSPQKMLDLLKSLGIHRVSDFLKLPESSISARFGSMGLFLYQRVSGSLLIPWPIFVPQEQVLEQCDLSTLEECGDLSSLLFQIKKIAHRIFLRLTGRGLRASKIELRLTLEAHSTVKNKNREILFDLPLPQGSTASFLPMVWDRLNYECKKNPLESNVQQISLEVLESVPAPNRQRDLLRDLEQEQEQWSAYVGRLCEKLGRAQVFTAKIVERYLPEKSWIKQDAAVTHQTQTHDLPYPRRPMRVLDPPLPLHRLGRYLISGEQRFKIQSWSKPERITGEWTESTSFCRTYYTVETGQERLWIFKDGMRPDGGLFLGGIFE